MNEVYYVFLRGLYDIMNEHGQSSEVGMAEKIEMHMQKMAVLFFRHFTGRPFLDDRLLISFVRDWYADMTLREEIKMAKWRQDMEPSLHQRKLISQVIFGLEGIDPLAMIIRDVSSVLPTKEIPLETHIKNVRLQRKRFYYGHLLK